MTCVSLVEAAVGRTVWSNRFSVGRMAGRVASRLLPRMVTRSLSGVPLRSYFEVDEAVNVSEELGVIMPTIFRVCMEALCLVQPVFAGIACTRLTDVEDVAGVPLLVATGFSLGLVAHEHAVDRDSFLGVHPI